MYIPTLKLLKLGGAMIRFVYGTYGSGKTTEIINAISQSADNKARSFLIVPDQEALQYERLTLSMLPPSSQLELEILGFSRLYNRVCREYGGLSYSYITKPIRSLMMWKSVKDLSCMLESFKNEGANDILTTDMMLCAVDELKANGISAAALELASNKLPTSSPLRARLRDIALIYSCFDNFVAEKYSDSSNDLMRLLDILKQHDFFKGANVYIDSFTSYTSLQHKIIEQIFRSAENVTVSIPLSSPDSDDISTYGIQASHKKLLDSAERYGGHTDVVLSSSLRANSPALVYLSENLWKMDSKATDAPPVQESIICEICDNPYAECEAVAAHILELLRKGARCRDMVIIARNCDTYRGILDTALEKSGIPFFFSRKSELCSMAPVKFILSALRIKKYNWQKNDVISHIKTGLCNIDSHDADLFEEYVNTWNIHGNQFLYDCWDMNPDGLVANISARGQIILEAANRVREALITPLVRLFDLLDNSQNIPDMCKALFSYMQEVSLEEKIAELSKKAAARADLKQARELSRIYEIILYSLADAADALSNEAADVEEFIHILRNIFNKTEIGTIPTSIDEVTVGSAAMLRASNPKYAFVIGLCEGEFPASLSDNGIFSSIERKELFDLGIELSGNNDIRSSDELMYVSRAFSLPSDKLFLFTHKSELDGTTRFPSLAFNRVEKLFGEHLSTHAYKQTDLEYLVGAPKNTANLLRSLDDGVIKASVREALNAIIDDFAELSQKDPSTDTCHISSETIKSAIGNSLHLSFSSFEKYVKCPFDYYCSRILNLRDKKSSEFKANDIGSFVHYLLEILIKASIPKNPDEPLPDDESLISMATAEVENYVRRICPPSLVNSKKLNHLYERLKNLSVLLVKNTVKEFSQSDFRPAFYELRSDGKGSNPSPMIFSLDNGCKVSFSGIIDRVDVYRKDEKIYVRIIDYKTGTKDFSIDDIEHGINLQMLVYLFTLCRNDSTKFKRSLGLKDTQDTLPAGVIYVSTAIPTIEASDYSTTSTVLSEVEDSFKRTGLILEDEDVLYAMNHELDTRFLAGIKKNKSDELEGKALASSEDFANIFEKISSTIRKIAGELHSGNANASPLSYKNQLPCDYCSSKPICRRVNK